MRALINGGWGFVSFNEPSDLRRRAEEAVAQARHVGKEKSVLAPVEPVVDIVKADILKDPRKITPGPQEGAARRL